MARLTPQSCLSLGWLDPGGPLRGQGLWPLGPLHSHTGPGIGSARDVAPITSSDQHDLRSGLWRDVQGPPPLLTEPSTPGTFRNPEVLTFHSSSREAHFPWVPASQGDSALDKDAKVMGCGGTWDPWQEGTR